MSPMEKLLGAGKSSNSRYLIQRVSYKYHTLHWNRDIMKSKVLEWSMSDCSVGENLMAKLEKSCSKLESRYSGFSKEVTHQQEMLLAPAERIGKFFK